MLSQPVRENRCVPVEKAGGLSLLRMEGGVQGQQPVFSPAYVSWQKSRVWVVTFISYTCFHLARKVRDRGAAPLEMSPLGGCASLSAPVCFLSRCEWGPLCQGTPLPVSPCRWRYVNGTGAPRL